MNNRITSLRIDWFSNELASSADELHWRLEVYRNHGVQRYTTYNGVGEKMREEKYGLHDFQRENIFTALEAWEKYSPWDKYYGLDEDAFVYTIRIRYSNRSIKTIQGAVVFPPHWTELSKMLSAMCEMPLDGARNTIDWICDRDEKITYESICKKLGFDPMKIPFDAYMEKYGNIDDAPGPFASKLSMEELDFLVEYVYGDPENRNHILKK